MGITIPGVTMKFLAILAAIVLFLPLALPAGNSGSSIDPNKVDAYIQPYIDVGGFSGAVLVAKGGKILISKGYGMANYELSVPNTPHTKFHLASVSKTFTAGAIMILQQRGQLNVNDPLSKFIPDYPNGEKIMIYHLLTNTSGIPNINNLPDYDKQSKFPHTPADLIAMFKTLPLDFNPGEKEYTESNSNYNLLAYIIEKQSGLSYGEFLRANIFEPLGMKDSGHDGDAQAILPNHADGYVPAGINQLRKVPYMDWSIKTGNGSIYSTTEDLYKWDRALYTDKILSKTAIDTMFAKEYGWFNSKRANRNAIRMSGRSPGFQSEFQRYVTEDACVIVLGNNYSPTSSLIGDALAAMLFGEKYEPVTLHKPVAVDPKILQSYAGRYQFGPDFFVPDKIYRLEINAGQLVVNSEGSQTILLPQNDTEFFIPEFWSTISFQRSSEGQATGLVWRYGTKDFPAKKLPD
jgi:CubicO group peptidase (beta-lactamase class C family)